MRRLHVYVFLVLTGGCYREQPSQGANQIRGSWNVVRLRSNGEEHTPSVRMHVEFGVNKLTITTEGEPEFEAMYQLNDSADPKNLDIIKTVTVPGEVIPTNRATSTRNENSLLDQRWLGIYKVDGDELQLCFDNGQRPAEFSNNASTLLVLRRNRGN